LTKKLAEQRDRWAICPFYSTGLTKESGSQVLRALTAVCAGWDSLAKRALDDVVLTGADYRAALEAINRLPALPRRRLLAAALKCPPSTLLSGTAMFASCGGNLPPQHGSSGVDHTRAVPTLRDGKAREALLSRLTSVSKQASRSRRSLPGAFLESS
jgi:hypothetical protein